MKFGEMWKCADCGADNSRQWEKCVQCGAPRAGEQGEGMKLKPGDTWQCRHCSMINQKSIDKCAGCGQPRYSAPPVQAQPRADAAAGRVTIVDIDIPWASLTVLLIKLALAAIPAAIIVALIYGLGTVLIGGLFMATH